MTTVAYIANAFPSPVEPYVLDEIAELHRRGVRVICCSAQRVSRNGLSVEERKYWQETRNISPLQPIAVARAICQFADARRKLEPIFQAAFEESTNSRKLIRVFAHTLLGVILANELRSSGVDHIHAHHGYYASWMALIASRLLGITFSLTLHGSDLLLHENLLGTKLRFCRFCVTISNYNRDYILQKFPETKPSKILVQRLGVDVGSDTLSERPQPLPESPLLLSVGRLNHVKNYEFLIRACAALRDQGHKFQCWVAGDGPERRNLEQLIYGLQLESRVRLLGHVSRAKLQELYRRAALFVLTSRSEGIPVVLMEAMAAGTMVLAPDITGIPELVQHGKNGFLYRQGSSPDFIDSVRWILDRRSVLNDIRRAAQQTISAHYNRQHNLSKFSDHFLARLGVGEDRDENPLLQQVQLSL